MSAMNIYPIDKERIDNVAIKQEGTNYDRWEKAVLMVSYGDRISRVIGWANKTNLPVERQVEVTKDEYTEDKGVTIAAEAVFDAQGAKRIKYVKKYDVKFVVTRLGWNSVQHVKGVVAVNYATTTYKKGEAIAFYTGDCYVHLYKAIMPKLLLKHVKFQDTDNNFNMTSYLVPFGILGNFGEYMDRYMEDADKPGGKIETFTLEAVDPVRHDAGDYNDDEQAVFMERNAHVKRAAAGLGGIEETELTITEDIAYAFAYTHLFMLVKTGLPEHLKTALGKRLSAMKNALKFEHLNVDEFLQKRIVFDQYLKANDRMNFYPKLKATIFSCVLANNDNFNSHIKSILKEAQFTVYNLMVTFVHAPLLTTLHVVDEVMDDYEKFTESFDALKIRYGENWPFCKLVNPNETLGTLAKFPALQNAAKAYAFTTQQSDSLTHLKGMRNVPGHYFFYARAKLSETTVRGVRDAEYVKSKLKSIRSDRELDLITDELLKTARDNAEQFIRDKRNVDRHILEFLNSEAR